MRAELGHATNAICIVGRRERTRGLFLDRRAFLNSYDPTQDDANGMILSRILRAAVPICVGISLAYFFSRVDNVSHGCGTKLPRNIVSLLGVVDGAGGDVHTGMPWQMVEIHKPVRLLLVVEPTSQILQRIMDSNSGLGRLIRNQSVELAILDPNSPQILVYRSGRFEDYRQDSENLPEANSSWSWYRG